LRDQMTDLELALTTLAETTAAVLHRQRGSEGAEKLLGDVRDAGEIVASTIADIERRGGMMVAQPVVSHEPPTVQGQITQPVISSKVA